MAMVSFDVRFAGSTPPGWLVRETDGPDRWFASRFAAIRFAMARAGTFGLGAQASIQGQDSVWRSFDHAGRATGAEFR
jgi:hypothetical protein